MSTRTPTSDRAAITDDQLMAAHPVVERSRATPTVCPFAA